MYWKRKRNLPFIIDKCVCPAFVASVHNLFYQSNKPCRLLNTSEDGKIGYDKAHMLKKRTLKAAIRQNLQTKWKLK